MDIVYRKIGALGACFQLHSGEVSCVEGAGNYIYKGSDSVARELVVRHGFRYAKGSDRDWLEKLIAPRPPRRPPAKKATPPPKLKAIPKAPPKPAPKPALKPAPKVTPKPPPQAVSKPAPKVVVSKPAASKKALSKKAEAKK